MLGAFLVDLFYEVEYINYSDKALSSEELPVKDITKHKAGLAVWKNCGAIFTSYSLGSLMVAQPP
jgi:hypothetical protein